MSVFITFRFLIFKVMHSVLAAEIEAMNVVSKNINEGKIQGIYL